MEEDNYKSCMSNSPFTNLSEKHAQILKSTNPTRLLTTLSKENAQKLKNIKVDAKGKNFNLIRNTINENIKNGRKFKNSNIAPTLKVSTEDNKKQNNTSGITNVNSKFKNQIKRDDNNPEKNITVFRNSGHNQYHNEGNKILNKGYTHQYVERKELQKRHLEHDYEKPIAAQNPSNDYKSLDERILCGHCGGKERKEPVMPKPNDPNFLKDPQKKPTNLKRKKPLIVNPSDPCLLQIYIKRNEELERRVKELEGQQKKILEQLKKFVTFNHLKKNYYDKQYINNNFVTTKNLTQNYYDRNIINNKFSSHYNQINQRVTKIENDITALINQLQKLDDIEQKIVILGKQGKDNKALINEYFTEIAKMISLTQKNLKIYKRDKLVTKPEKIFDFLFNSMMGLQLERKRDALKSKIGQHNKKFNDYSININNSNSDMNNNIINNFNDYNGIIEPDAIMERIKKECKGMGLNVTKKTLQAMTNIGIDIIKNDEKKGKERKSPSAMMKEKTEDLKTIANAWSKDNQNLAIQNKAQKNINNKKIGSYIDEVDNLFNFS